MKLYSLCPKPVPAVFVSGPIYNNFNKRKVKGEISTPKICMSVAMFRDVLVD